MFFVLSAISILTAKKFSDGYPDWILNSTFLPEIEESIIV